MIGLGLPGWAWLKPGWGIFYQGFSAILDVLGLWVGGWGCTREKSLPPDESSSESLHQGPFCRAGRTVRTVRLFDLGRIRAYFFACRNQFNLLRSWLWNCQRSSRGGLTFPAPGQQCNWDKSNKGLNSGPDCRRSSIHFIDGCPGGWCPRGLDTAYACACETQLWR